MTKKVSKVKEGVVKAYVNVENAVVGSYKAIENAAVGGYKAIENAAVGGYKRIEDKAVEFGHSPSRSTTARRISSNALIIKNIGRPHWPAYIC